MKKLFLLLLTIGLGFTAQAQIKPGEFKFEAETHDFGKIKLDQPATFTFNFTNEGEAPLIITKVEPTCGCTIGEYTQTPVKKGETVTSNARTTVKVLYLKGETVN